MTYTRLCANESCGKQFETEYDTKIYCSAKCKQCTEHRRYRRSHREKFKKYASMPERKEYMHVYRKKYWAEHKPELRVKARERYQEHKEELVQYGRDYRKKNTEKLRKYWRERYQKKKAFSTEKPLGKTFSAEQNYIRKCVQCGKEFQTSKNRAIFCSQACRDESFGDSKPFPIKQYNKEYYMKNRASLIEKARIYRDEHRDKYRETQRRLYDMGKASKLKTCIECGRRFKPRNKMIKICSDKCRITRQTRRIREYYKKLSPEEYRKQRNRSDTAKVGKFYKENPFSIYMPDRKKLVDRRNERIGYGVRDCKRCGERFVRMANRNEKYCESCKHKYKHLTRREWDRDKSLTTGEIIALHNAEVYMESGEMEKIDLDTLRGIPSEQKDAIIKALFEALKAKKETETTEETMPKERKITQRGAFYLEVDKLKKGEYVPLFELMAKAGVSSNEYMKDMNIFHALRNIPDGVIGIQVCKTGVFPSGWLEENLYRKHSGGWHRKKRMEQ